MDKNENFGDRLKKARNAAGLTQEQLASALGKKSKLSISGWEQGKQSPPIDTLKDICEILGCSADYLLHGKDIVSEPPAGLHLVNSAAYARFMEHENKKLAEENERLKNNQTVPNEA